MSAQIIAALNKRADALDAEVKEMQQTQSRGKRHPRDHIGWGALAAIADEFRALAKEAEGLQ